MLQPRSRISERFKVRLRWTVIVLFASLFVWRCLDSRYHFGKTNQQVQAEQEQAAQQWKMEWDATEHAEQWCQAQHADWDDGVMHKCVEYRMLEYHRSRTLREQADKEIEQYKKTHPNWEEEIKDMPTGKP